MHAATMSEDCMAIMQTNDKLQPLLQPQHLEKVSKQWILNILVKLR